MQSTQDSIIERFLDKKGYDTVFNTLSAYIEDNPEKLDLLYGSNLVEEPDGARLEDIELIRTGNVSIDGGIVSFTAIVSADIEIEETVSRNRETDSVIQWFELKCEFDADNALIPIRVFDVNIYSK